MALKTNKEESKKGFSIEVTRAKALESGAVGFDVTINGIKIYNCYARTVKSKSSGEDVTVIDFPSYKGKDGKYYNLVWAPLTLESKEEIEKQINNLL